jgi:Proliferating cell nuclear antigen, C-terminal domain
VQNELDLFFVVRKILVGRLYSIVLLVMAGTCSMADPCGHNFVSVSVSSNGRVRTHLFLALVHGPVAELIMNRQNYHNLFWLKIPLGFGILATLAGWESKIQGLTSSEYLCFSNYHLTQSRKAPKYPSTKVIAYLYYFTCFLAHPLNMFEMPMSVGRTFQLNRYLFYSAFQSVDKLMDVDSELIMVNEILYSSVVSLPSDKFQCIVRDLQSLGNVCTINTRGDGIKFSVASLFLELA